MTRKRNEKKGVSPIIATVLLIAMIVVIGLIVFLWFSGMTEESITKFGGTNIKLACDDVQFDADYSDSTGTLSIVNIGNVPIFEMKIRISKEGSHSTKNLKELSENWPKLGLNQGGTFSDVIDVENVKEILLIPVLVGTSDKGEKTFTCEERHGHEIVI